MRKHLDNFTGTLDAAISSSDNNDVTFTIDSPSSPLSDLNFVNGQDHWGVFVDAEDIDVFSITGAVCIGHRGTGNLHSVEGAAPATHSAGAPIASYITAGTLQHLRIGPGEYALEDFPTLAAALTAIGSNQCTLTVSTSYTVAENDAIPANVMLRFQGAGQLNVGSSYNVAINGPIIAAPVQIFGGAGTVSIGGLVPEAWAEWWGVKGDTSGTTGNGTDVGPIVNKALTSLASGGLTDLKFAGGWYRTTQTFQITNTSTYNYKVAQRVYGGGLVSEFGIGSRSTIYWDGNSTDPAFGMYTLYSLVEGFNIVACGGKILNVAIDQTKLDASPDICTALRVKDVTISGGTRGPGTVNYGIRTGYQLGSNSVQNCEFFEFDNVTILGCAAASWYIPNSTCQSKNHVLRSCNFSGNGSSPGAGIAVVGGSFTAYDSDFSAFAYPGSPAIYIAAGYEPSTLIGCHGEGDGQLLANHSSMLFAMRSCRWSADYAIDPGTDSSKAWVYSVGDVYIESTVWDDLSQNQYNGSNPCFIACKGIFEFRNSALPDNSDVLGQVRWATTDTNPSGAMQNATATVVSPNVVTNIWNGGTSNAATFRSDLIGIIPTGNMGAGSPLKSATYSNQAILQYDPAMNRLDLIENAGLRRRVTSTALLDAQVSAVASGSGSVPSGGYIYGATFVSALGATALAAPNWSSNNDILFYPNSVYVSGSQGVAISAIPVGPPGTTARNLYRSEGGGAWGYVGHISDNVTTTFTDTNATYTGVAPPGSSTGIVPLQLGGLNALSVATDSSAGSGSPTGFIDVLVNGVLKKIPTYDN